jgi:hypothetical protein
MKQINIEFDIVTRRIDISEAVGKFIAGEVDCVKISKEIADMAFMRQLSINTSAEMPLPQLTAAEQDRHEGGETIVKKASSLLVSAELGHFTLRLL